MNTIIDNLDISGLEKLWNATFTDKEDEFNTFIENQGYETDEELMKEMKEILKDEIYTREKNKPPAQEVEEFYPERRGFDEDDDEMYKLEQEREEINKQIKELQEKEHQLNEEINEEKDKRKSMMEEIKKKYDDREKRISELYDVYNRKYPDAEFVEDKNDFYEWLRNKDAPANEETINEFIESIAPNSIIDFEKLNRNDRSEAFDRMKAKLEEVIGELAMTEKYSIRFRINGEWKSKTLTTDVWRKLMESLDKQEFIYGKEYIDNSYVHFSNDAEDSVFKLVHFDAIAFVPIKESGNTRKDNRKSFFPYLNTTDIDLSRYQIFDSIVRINKKGKAKQLKQLDDSCFVYALKMFGINEDTLNKIRNRIHTRKLGLAKMDLICEEFDLHVTVHDLEYTNARNSIFRVNGKNYFGTEKGLKIDINAYKGHYFLEEKTIYSSDYIKHKYIMHEDIPEVCYDKRLRGDHWILDREPKRYISSGKLIKLLFENGYFKPITYNNARILSTTLYKDSEFIIDDLHYSDKHCTRIMKPKGKKDKIKFTYYYADFEADVSKNPHKPYMCVLQSLDGYYSKTYTGEDCDKQLIEFLSRCNNPCVYFHNLKYDFSFLAKYGMRSSIQKGTRLMKAVIEYNGTKIYFRDTLPILSCKLSQLPSMFNIQGVQKELFPYKYYTIERLNEKIGVISEAGKDEDKPWGDEEYKLFNENIDKIEGCRIDEDHFYMYKYAEFYCKQDVNILRQAFNKFASDFKKEFNINPFEFISISSLANEVFKRNVYYPNGNLYEVGGHVREFMAQAVKGGRCMTAYNKKWHITDTPKDGVPGSKALSDYDAVSLYPSAMSRLYTVEGKPEVIEYSAQNLSSIPPELSKYSAFIIEIRITKVGKHYPFPLIIQKTEEGNLNKDTEIDEEHPLTLIVDNIYLEDLINFQLITFDVIRGYGWTGKKDYRIQKVITNIFNKRLEYKKTNNPLQQLYKLIMNSCYGKCIEKPVMKDAKYLEDKIVETSHKNYQKKTNRKSEPYNPYLRYLEKHYNEIVEDVEIGSGVHEIKRLRPTDIHFNNSLLGIQILSMSKRIMNEVMCLAYDIGCHIFYQDTDSMHIYKDDLVKLENAYKEKYSRELKGKNLCQFHSDFPEIPNGTKGEVPVSIHSIFIAKKVYLDVLTDSSGKIHFMIRGKGLTQESIKATAERYGGLEKLYEAIYNGEEVAFDLAEGQPSFLFNKDFTVSSNEHFIRKVKAKYEEGKLEEYFA